MRTDTAIAKKPTLCVVGQDAAGELVGQDWPLLPDAEYIARVKHWETRHIFRSPRLFLHVEIVDGRHSGATLFAAFALREIVGKPGHRGRFKIARRSKLLLALTRLTGQRIRGDRISLNWLTRSLLRIRTRTVTHDHAQTELPMALRYSCVADLVAIEAG